MEPLARRARGAEVEGDSVPVWIDQTQIGRRILVATALCGRVIVGVGGETPTIDAERAGVDPAVAIEGMSVVLRGAFVPALFSPAWFKEVELVGAAEVREPEVEIINRELAIFQMSWLNVHVTPDALQLSTGEVEEFPRLRDAISGALRTLDGTPVGALGMNRYFHTALPTLDHLNRIGDAIAPKDIWSGSLDLPGMRSSTIWGARPDGLGGHVQVQVEPSIQVAAGVYVGINDHFDLRILENAPSSREEAYSIIEPPEPTVEKRDIAIQILSEHWDASLVRAQLLHDRVVSFSEER